jgi:hypothetical protein
MKSSSVQVVFLDFDGVVIESAIVKIKAQKCVLRIIAWFEIPISDYNNPI